MQIQSTIGDVLILYNHGGKTGYSSPGIHVTVMSAINFATGSGYPIPATNHYH